MAGERRYIPASEFCVSVRDGTHDSPKPVQNGRKLATSRHLTTGRLDLSDAYLISEKDFEAINKRSKVDRWDVLISMIGTVGEPCLIIEEPDFAIKNIGLFKTRSELDGKWLYYYLRTKDAQQCIREQSRGTTQQYIPLRALRDIPILVAEDPKEQKAIVGLLGALDDKIELNRRMNETLEAMARALFNSWFVDFDPVRAKRDGRQPAGMDATSAALFPDSFTHNGSLVYPTGWTSALVTEDICLARGIEPGRDACNNEGIGRRFIRVGDVTGKRESDLFTNIETEVDIKMGEIIVSFDGTPGAVSYTSEGVFSTGLRKLEGLRTKFHPCYLWCLAKSDEFQSTIKEYSIGTTILHASAAIPHLRRVVSSSEVMKAFGSLVDPIWKQMLSHHAESRTLTALRDALLPKLLSGELRVPIHG